MSDLYGAILKQISEERVRYARDFFQSRGLSFKNILKAFKYQIDEYKHLLLTSSPVHGISNVKSDIDVICITVEPVPSPRMAIQSFESGNHYEIISFSRDELAGALKLLEELSEMSMAAALEKMGAWNKNCVISRKYTERIVNGVDISLSTPYIASLFQLGIVWKQYSFDMFRKCIILAILAEKTGEMRGRVGYAMNGLLYLMDCIMSHHTYVFSNKKWYLYRYKKFLQEKRYTVDFKPIIADIESLYQLLTDEIKGFGQSLIDRLVDLYQSSKAQLGLKFREQPLICLNPRVEKEPFLENSSVYYDGKKNAVLFWNKKSEVHPDSIRDLKYLDQPESASVLNRIRARVLNITIPQ
jgi:hypothetical protein